MTRFAARWSSFEGLQVGDQVADLADLESKLRHGGMRGHDTFGERLCKILDRVAEMESAEGRCCWQGACTRAAYSMTRRAVRPGEGVSALNPLVLRVSSHPQKPTTCKGAQRYRSSRGHSAEPTSREPVQFLVIAMTASIRGQVCALQQS